jgi:hypothetical protein
VVGALPVAGRHAAEVALEAQRPLVLVAVERAAGLQPVRDALLAREDVDAGELGGRAGHGGADLGQLALVLGQYGVVGFALGEDLALVLGQLLGGQVAAFAGGAGEDRVGGLAGGTAPLGQLVE